MFPYWLSYVCHVSSFQRWFHTNFQIQIVHWKEMAGQSKNIWVFAFNLQVIDTLFGEMITSLNGYNIIFFVSGSKIVTIHYFSIFHLNRGIIWSSNNESMIQLCFGNLFNKVRNNVNKLSLWLGESMLRYFCDDDMQCSSLAQHVWNLWWRKSS